MWDGSFNPCHCACAVSLIPVTVGLDSHGQRDDVLPSDISELYIVSDQLVEEAVS
jgi:hypothetical protein